jgi:hypothetical protein
VIRCRAFLILFSNAVEGYMGFKLLDRLKIVVLVYACQVLNKLVKLICFRLQDNDSQMTFIPVNAIYLLIVCNMFISYFVETWWEKGPRGE